MTQISLRDSPGDLTSILNILYVSWRTSFINDLTERNVVLDMGCGTLIPSLLSANNLRNYFGIDNGFLIEPYSGTFRSSHSMHEYISQFSARKVDYILLFELTQYLTREDIDSLVSIIRLNPFLCGATLLLLNTHYPLPLSSPDHLPNFFPNSYFGNHSWAHDTVHTFCSSTYLNRLFAINLAPLSHVFPLSDVQFVRAIASLRFKTLNKVLGFLRPPFFRPSILLSSLRPI